VDIDQTNREHIGAHGARGPKYNVFEEYVNAKIALTFKMMVRFGYI
jgi:hypothetical protein